MGKKRIYAMYENQIIFVLADKGSTDYLHDAAYYLDAHPSNIRIVHEDDVFKLRRALSTDEIRAIASLELGPDSLAGNIHPILTA